jgi:RNA polymerase sigma-70 factor (ECF subfamily)
VIAEASADGLGFADAVHLEQTADSWLVDRCKRGDRAAFDELYRRHVDAVYRRLRRLLLRREHEIEDLVQQVFLEAFRGLPRFRGQAAFSTWLYRITVNVAMASMRRSKRRPLELIDPELIDELSAKDASPAMLAEDRELLLQSLRHLGELKAIHRIAFLLRYVEDREIDEIAELVGAKPPAVRQRIKKAETMLAARQRRAGREA